MASAVTNGTSGGLGSQWGNLGYLKGVRVYVYMDIYIYIIFEGIIHIDSQFYVMYYFLMFLQN